MLTGIIYNCNTESLAEVDQTEFVEAFENEVRVKPIYRDLSISVTFNDSESEVTEFASDDSDADMSREEDLREQFARFAEKAFAVCLS